jgi:glycerate kinase
VKIVIATDSFKGTLSSREAGLAMQRGVRKALPDARTEVLPVADGGEGTVEAVVTVRHGRNFLASARDPYGSRIRARLGEFDQRRAVILEMAASSGLTLLPEQRRDPTRTSTQGAGDQLMAAVARGARTIWIGVGGSATVDGGCGAAQALGVRFFDRRGRPIRARLCGGNLDRIGRIDVGLRDSRLDACDLRVLCDVTNPLCGPRGAARVFAPQKFRRDRPVPTKELKRLERNLEHLAAVIHRDLGIEVANLRGAGAAGGLAAGLHAFAGAQLVRGVDAILDLIDFDRRLTGADLVITGEGALDAQTLHGKTAAGIGARARRQGVRVIAIAGSFGPGAEQCRRLFHEIHAVCGPADAIPAATRDIKKALAEVTTRVLRRCS